MAIEHIRSVAAGTGPADHPQAPYGHRALERAVPVGAVPLARGTGEAAGYQTDAGQQR